MAGTGRAARALSVAAPPALSGPFTAPAALSRARPVSPAGREARPRGLGECVSPVRTAAVDRHPSRRTDSMSGGLVLVLVAAAISVAPSPEIGFVLQCSGVGALIGSALGLLRQRRDADTNVGRATALGGLLGAVVGLSVTAVAWLLF